MDKKIVIFVLALVIIIGASMGYVLLRKDKDDVVHIDKNVSSNTETKPADEDKEQIQPTAKGAYLNYSDKLVASTKGTKLLFFHAPWCPQCRALDESIRNSALPDGVTIFKVDYDSNQALRAKYGVTLQTTIVKIDNEGSKIASYVAYNDPTFQNMEQALLHD